MSLLKDFETRLEKIVEGVFAKGFKSALQPVELAKKLSRTMEDNRTVSVSKVYIPNHYTIQLSPEDYDEFTSFEAQLQSELKNFLYKKMRARKYSTIGDIQIVLRQDKKISLGQVEIEGKLVADETTDAGKDAVTASLELSIGDNEETFFLTKKPTAIGRLENNNIVIPDPSISRHHAEISYKQGQFYLVDLNSANGTFLNGRKIEEKRMKNSDQIGLGKVTLIFRRFS